MNIKKLSAGLIGAFAALFVALTPVSASSLETIQKSTYKLFDGENGACSAQAISPTQLITAFHCVDGSNLSIRTEKLDENFKLVSSDIEYVKVIRGMKSKDVALLELRDPSTRLPTWVDVAAESEVKLKFGDPVVAIGYPMVKDLTITHGEFTGFVPWPNTHDDMEGGFYKVTTPVTGGSSGGGLYVNFGTEGYKLVGTTTGGYSNVSFMAYFSNTKSLNEVMKNLVETEKFDESVVVEELELTPPATPDESNELINPSDEK